VSIDVYRGCTWKEKRDVLNVFWRTNVDASSRVGEAAVQYGYYAIICLAIVIVELAVILVVAFDRNALVAALSVLAELFMFWSTWWAAKRYRVLKYQFATGETTRSS
jgi:membrane protein YdbS with pleckstrin-like domain